MVSQIEVQENIKSLSTKLYKSELDYIVKLVKEGLFLNSADFVREAISDKLKTFEAPVFSRDFDYSQMRNELIGHVKVHPDVDTVDFASNLLFDVFEVKEIILKLIK